MNINEFINKLGDVIITLTIVIVIGAMILGEYNSNVQTGTITIKHVQIPGFEHKYGIYAYQVCKDAFYSRYPELTVKDCYITWIDWRDGIVDCECYYYLPK